MLISPCVTAVILFTAGILLLTAGSWFTVQNYRLKQHGVITTGQIEESRPYTAPGEADNCPRVTFTRPDGSKTTFRSAWCGKQFHAQGGKPVRVIYPPGSPDDAQIYSVQSFLILPGALLVIGAGFLLTGGGMLFLRRRRRRAADHLRRTGRPVQAQITSVTIHRAFALNGRHPYRIEAVVLQPLTGISTRYRSRNLYDDPRPYLQQESITVWLDRDNPAKYYMDISFLPETD